MTMTVVNMAAAATSTARYGCRVKAPLRYDVVPGGGSKPGASGDEGTFSIDILKYDGTFFRVGQFQ